jgi:hypothetical protein
MQRMMNGFHLSLLCSLILISTTSYAAIYAPPKPFELIAAGSISKVHAGNAQLGVTSDETDSLMQTNDGNWGSWGGQMGLGYVYLLSNAQRYSDVVQWFPMVEPELNV